MQSKIKEKDREIEILRLKIKDLERNLHNFQTKPAPKPVRKPKNSRRSQSINKRDNNIHLLDNYESPHETLPSKEESIRLPNIIKSREKPVFESVRKPKYETPRSKRVEKVNMTDPDLYK